MGSPPKGASSDHGGGRPSRVPNHGPKGPPSPVSQGQGAESGPTGGRRLPMARSPPPGVRADARYWASNADNRGAGVSRG